MLERAPDIPSEAGQPVLRPHRPHYLSQTLFWIASFVRSSCEAVFGIEKCSTLLSGLFGSAAGSRRGGGGRGGGGLAAGGARGRQRGGGGARRRRGSGMGVGAGGRPGRGRVR